MAPALTLLALVSAAHGLRMTGQDSAAASVPFFMYSLPEWTKRCDASKLHHQNIFPDVAFYEVMRSHHWRVHEASEAKILVVPGYFGLSAIHHCGDHEENMNITAAMLLASPSFRERPRQHLMSCFIFSCKSVLKGFLPFAEQMMVLFFEDKAFSRPVVVPYGPVSVRGAVAEPSPARKEHSLFFIGGADKRLAYRLRRRALHLLPKAFGDTVLQQALPEEHYGIVFDFIADPVELKKPLPLCRPPLLETGCAANRSFADYERLGRLSKFALVMAGDTPSTSRLYDAHSFQQLPIIVSDRWRKLAAPFKQDMPWSDVAVFVTETEFTWDAPHAMKTAMASWRNRSKQALWAMTRPLLDWGALSPCMGTALLSDAARRYLNVTELQPAWLAQECRWNGNEVEARQRAYHSAHPERFQATSDIIW